MVSIGPLPQNAKPYPPEVEEYARGLVAEATAQRLPELFAAQPAALYQLPDRHGAGVVALPSTALTEEQLIKLLKFRMAQYISIHFADHQRLYDGRIAHEPLATVAPGDVHVIAGNHATGEILCYAVLRAAPDAPPGTTLRDRNRPLFRAEELYGWGIYNRLRILPDLPMSKVRDIGRFMKNQQLSTLDELSTRGPIEVGVAVFHLLTGLLRMEIDAFVGNIEEGVAGQNLAFFHAPMVVIHSTPPYEGEESWMLPHHQYRTTAPFAALVSDLAEARRTRLPAVEQALELPGKQGIMALLTLKRDIHAARSSLEPPEHLEALIDTALPQQGVAMQTRRAMLDQANRLLGAGIWSYAYNGDGLRMSKGGIAPTQQTWDVAAGIPLLVQDGATNFIYGSGGMLVEQVQSDGTPDYYHADQLGSVRALTNGSGAVVNTYTYDAYGNRTGSSETVANPFGYAGEYRDAESGFYYLRARYYDPSTQQFLTRDPLLPITGEAYNYVDGNPINAKDSRGLVEEFNGLLGRTYVFSKDETEALATFLEWNDAVAGGESLAMENGKKWLTDPELIEAFHEFAKILAPIAFSAAVFSIYLDWIVKSGNHLEIVQTCGESLPLSVEGDAKWAEEYGSYFDLTYEFGKPYGTDKGWGMYVNLIPPRPTYDYIRTNGGLKRDQPNPYVLP